MNIECPICHGKGDVWQESENGLECWKEVCKICNGIGSLENTVVTNSITTPINEEIVYITKKEYEELLEYKYMYEKLCE